MIGARRSRPRPGRAAAVLAMGGIVLFLAAGCGSGMRRGRTERIATLQAAERAFLEGRFDEAAHLYREIQTRNAGTETAARAAYWEGISLLELGRAAEARAKFQEVHAAAPTPRLEARALQGIGRTLLLEEKWAEAEAAYRRLQREFPREADGAEMLAALAVCARERGDDAEAARLAQMLRTRYPENPYTAGAADGAGGGAAGGVRLYRVQAGAFSTRAKAIRLQARLARSGIQSVLVRRSLHGRTLHAVQTGAFSTRTAATRQARTLRARGFEAAIR